MWIRTVFLIPAVLSWQAFSASPDTGPLIKDFGKHFEVKMDQVVKDTDKFKVVFDVAQSPGGGKLNRRFDSLARFLNMHAAAGVKPENLQLALVVHGKAGFDLLSDEAYRQRFGQANPNLPLLKALKKQNTKILICGQSAAYHQIQKSELAEGVEMALSAMTANALLQQQGFTLNPF